MGRARRHFDWGLSRGFFLSGTLIVVQVYRTSFFRKSKRYHVLSFAVFPRASCSRSLSVSYGLINHQLSTIINPPLSRVPPFSPSLLTLSRFITMVGNFYLKGYDEFL